MGRCSIQDSQVEARTVVGLRYVYLWTLYYHIRAWSCGPAQRVLDTTQTMY